MIPSGRTSEEQPKDLDVFVTLRHFGPDGKEIFYTGTAGDPVPLVKGFLRASLRRVDEQSPLNRPYLPYRGYTSKDVSYLEQGKPYDLLVEIWPTGVVVEKGGRIVFEVSPKDTQGTGIFTHAHPEDRSKATFGGDNVLHFGPSHDNWLQLPIIPGAENVEFVQEEVKGNGGIQF